MAEMGMLTDSLSLHLMFAPSLSHLSVVMMAPAGDLGKLGGLSDGLGDVFKPVTAMVDAISFNCSNYQIMKAQIQHALGHCGH